MRNIQKIPIRQSGNALFLILIAVALFAALAYAVTQSDRGGSNALKEERLISSARLTEIGADLQVATLRMKMSGTPITDILLHEQATPDPELPCEPGANCLFGSEGGGAVWPELPQAKHIGKGASFSPPVIMLFEIADGAYVTGVASGQPLLLLVINNINEETCINLNKGLGIAGTPLDVYGLVISGQISAIPGKSEGCVKTDTGGILSFAYYHVLATP